MNSDFSARDVGFDLRLDEVEVKCLQHGLLRWRQKEGDDVHRARTLVGADGAECETLQECLGGRRTIEALCQSVETLKEIESHQGEELDKQKAFDAGGLLQKEGAQA